MVNKQTALLMRFFPVHVSALRVQRPVDTNRRVYKELKQAISINGMNQALTIEHASADAQLSRVQVLPQCTIRAQICIDLWRERRDPRFAFVHCFFDREPAPSGPPQMGGAR